MSSESVSTSKNPEAAPNRFRIIGIGASAGGLESLEQFFKNLPPNPNMAFVVVQHLSPDFRSVMDELLARHCDLPIQQAEHNIEVEPNHVYLMPPKKEMIIQERRLLLSDKERTHGLTLPIDQFFRSLAQDAGPDAVGIILSGSGSDGSRGVREIKRMGGRIFVENPDSANFDGMPLSALATGMVDGSAPAGEIPRLLNEEKKGAVIPPASDIDEFYNETPMESTLRLLRDQFGLDFSLYKTSTVSRRILRRVQLMGSVDVAEYAERLRVDPEELSSLYHDLLIGVTRFFRDPQAFDFLEQQVIPDILNRVSETEEIRIWVAGCATGEEAYSLAMLLFEQLTARGRPLNVKILSTDVHTASLTHASAGFYGEEQLENVSEKRRERFFAKATNGYHISQDLRQLIVFAPHNIIKDAPFTKMHLISCRNLLIYFEPPAQKTVVSLFHFGLATNGYLFLGPSEATGELADEFDAVNEHWKIYRKRRDVHLLEPLRLSMTRKAPGSHKSFLGEPRSTLADAHLLTVYDQLLDRHMPPSFLVNEDRQLVDSFGGAEELFRLGKRRPSTNVLDLLDGELRTVVAGAIQRALKKDGPVRYTGVPITNGDATTRHILCAETFTNPRSNSTHVLISIENESAGDERGITSEVHERSLTTAQASQERLSTLEAELSYTRETLQSTIEELQTSNEELQATNEELVASNEELQSTNEELHSVNEELYTVNAELQRKIAELRELNADMQHFLESTDVGTLFLDRNLCIRKYTPRIASVFHIQQQDIGRSIRHFSHNLKRSMLLQEIERALAHGIPVEDEVRDGDNTTYFLRILPYRSAAGVDPTDGMFGTYALGHIEGVVVSLTDISALERVRARLRHMSAIVESSEDAIIGAMLDGAITTWNRGAERLFGYSAEEAIGRHIRMLAPINCEKEIDSILESIQRGETVEQSETIRLRKDGSPLDISVTLSPVFDSEGSIAGVSAIGRDVAQLRKVEQDLAEREGRIRLLLDSTAEGIIGLGPDGLCAFVNPACVRLLGYNSTEELIGQHIHPLLHPHNGNNEHTHSERDCPIFNVFATGEGTHSDNETFSRADGSTFVSEYWSYPIRRGAQVVGLVVTFLDITDRKKAEEEIRTGARRREEFLAMLSHELRNPLAAVVSAATVMQAPNTKTESIDKARQIIERQSRHMARLLDDLLDVSRITRGGIELRKEDLDLRDVIRTAIEALTPVLDERRVQLSTELADVELPVRGDPARIQQVVVNLLSNAARYSPPRSSVCLTAVAEGDSVILKVKDHGRGILPSMLSEIFELFVQDAQGIERSTGGLGIGLTLVRQIVELHGGNVRAHSDGVGKGSEFIATFPRQRNAILHLRRESRYDSDARRILVVEDQEDSREMLRVLLESMGHIVLEASDGASAVAAIEREHPDVAVVDIGLPVMSGYDVARRVRQNQLFDDVVLVALTGYGRDSDIEEAKSAGFDTHVTKPADVHMLDQILAASMRRKAS